MLAPIMLIQAYLRQNMMDFMLFKKRAFLQTTFLSLCAMVFVSACSGNVSPRDNSDPVESGEQAPPVTGGPINPGSADNGEYRLEISATRISIREGGDSISVALRVVRENGHDAPINLALTGRNPADESNMRWQFSDVSLEGEETISDLLLELGVARSPILPHTREFTVIATDGNIAALTADITVEVAPTTAPDVYLQIGQSNMVGFSLPGARESNDGQADAPNGRVLQLNVTGNDDTNFPSAAAFTNVNNVANLDSAFVTALDPLHDGFDFSINGKASTFIGMGLSFGKSLLDSTTADILLVPAAWSDTGFCKTDASTSFLNIGWNVTAPTDTQNFAGTLLHDRALTRLNLALDQSGGIFRGMLWHQGEADSNSDVCAAVYEQNLKALVASIRTNARVDARGPQARGAAADVPFIAGTMSRGAEFNDFWPAKEIVDGVHRNVSSIIPFAASVNNDDLVPPAYPCGQGGCIHFGARAYREMGQRYAIRMREVQQR